MDERPHHPNRADSSQYESRYDILRPQCKLPSRPIDHRDRYRTTRYDDPMYDTVEDVGTDDLDFQLDSFGTCISMAPQHLSDSNTP